MRIWTIVIAVMVMAAGLLALRQQRINTASELVGLQRELDDARQTTWALQVSIGERLRPQWLQEAVRQTELALEPDLPMPGLTDPAGGQRVRFANGADGPQGTLLMEEPEHTLLIDAQERQAATPGAGYLPH